jgi:flagellar hook-associated protein 3 FlgL
MRVTERSRIGAMTMAQNRAAERLEKASRIASDGTRVTKPSDDPAAYGTKVRRDYTLAMLEEHHKTATRSLGELEVAHSALDAAVEIMGRAEESAVSGANGTLDPAAKKLLAEDVRTMREQLIAIANTKYGDKYVFAGTKSDKIPFDLTSGAFSGNDQIVRVPVMENVTPAANVSGAKAFTITGGRDIFADLKELSEALDANDDDRVRATMQSLQSGHDQLIRSQVEAGFGAERFRSALEVLTSTKTAVAEQLSKEIEGDPATQITEMQLAKTAYERSVAVTKQILNINTGG